MFFLAMSLFYIFNFLYNEMSHDNLKLLFINKTSDLFLSSPKKQVVVSVITGKGSFDSRIPNILEPIWKEGISTVSDDERNWEIIFGYVTETNFTTPFHSLIVPHCGNGQQMPMVCKFVESIKYASNEFQNLAWMLRITDDTYVNIPNLIKLVKDMNSSKAFYGGERYQRDDHVYADGGAGWLMSAATVHDITPRLDVEFLKDIVIEKNMPYDDVAFGHFMKDVMLVELVQLDGFLNELITLPQSENDLIVAENYHEFHTHLVETGQKTSIHSKNISIVTYHLRLGKQEGDPNFPRHNDANFTNELHSRISDRQIYQKKNNICA